MTTDSEQQPGTKAKCGTGWKTSAGTIAGVVFWMIIGAFVFNALTPEKPPQQGLRITNTGSQSVDVRNASASWGDNKVLTLHPGMSGFGCFATAISSASAAEAFLVLAIVNFSCLDLLLLEFSGLRVSAKGPALAMTKTDRQAGGFLP